MVGRDQAGRFHPRHHRGAYRSGPHRLWQRVHRRAPGPGGPESARAALSRRGRADAGTCERKAASEHVLDGARRNADPHDQRHRHRVVGHFGPGDRIERRPTARRRPAPPRAALLLAADGRAEGDVRCRRAVSRARLHGVQDRLGPVRPRARRQARRSDRARGARGGGRIASCSSMRARATRYGRTASNGRSAPPRC